jgi:hypothetical protein
VLRSPRNPFVDRVTFDWRLLETGAPPHVYGGGVRKPAQNCSRVNPVKIGLPDFHTWR